MELLIHRLIDNDKSMELLIRLMDNLLTLEDGNIDKRLMDNLLTVRAWNFLFIG